MHGLLVVAGVIIVLVIAVHIFFDVIKFTFAVLVLGIALIAVLYFFQTIFGIDLMGHIAAYL